MKKREMDKTHLKRNEPIRSPTPPMDSSIEDIDEFRIEEELEELDGIACTSKKPHFLDYDSIPPPGFEDDLNSAGSSTNINAGRLGKPVLKNAFFGEHKIEKKYETDGEISDFELTANLKKGSMTVSELESCDNSSIFLFNPNTQPLSNSGARRKKHFLDENPIPPDYELDREREHRSLDRNFERTKDYDIKYERKHSLDRERTKKVKEPSYTLTRFLEHDSPVYRGTWPSDRPNDTQCSSNFSDTTSAELKNLTPKVECVYSLLSMLGGKNQLEMSSKFLELSKSPGTCATLRHSRCIPLIVQMIHSDADEKTKKNATQALHNVVNCHPDDKAGRREAKVLRHIEQIMEYCDKLKGTQQREAIADDTDRHPLQAICSLMKISFDEEHRHAMCQLGALQAIASLVHYDHAFHGHDSFDDRCISLRRYAGMALTNLTFGDGNNKALLCTNREFMKALVAQLNSTADDLLQVTASVLRNLSWRADYNMKTVLNEIGTVTALSKAVMKNKNENTLKALLSALWNLSAHCSTNKAEFCAVDGALAFLCDMLVYEGPSKTLQIIENAGGILRNVSSHIAVREDYRKILRSRNCLGILLQQLSSESLTVVSNACGTLWNLSARCPEDQKFLLDNKAVSMLSLLIHSKHKMISNGSSAALKNLLNFRPGGVNHSNTDPIVKSMKLKELPSLNVRKQRALEHELDQNLSETCENIEVTTPPKEEKSIDDFIPHYEPSASSVIRLNQQPLQRAGENKDTPAQTIAKGDFLYDKQRINSKVTAVTSDVTKCKNNTVLDCTQTKETSNKRSHEFKQESINARPSTRKGAVSTGFTANSGTYQETDLDQLTDFSLRYAENQNEELDDEDEPKTTTTTTPTAATTTTTTTTTNIDEFGNEILLIVEDSVKCYQTEGTPYVISNAPSVSDLRAAKTIDPVEIKGKISKSQPNTSQNSGINTPEKPTKYCEEGTPGYFSRCDSFSSLNDASGAGDETINCTKRVDEVSTITTSIVLSSVETEIVCAHNPITPVSSGGGGDGDGDGDSGVAGGSSGGTGGANSNLQKAVTFADYAQETPLMFSRHSSLDSLSSAEPVIADDRSSVISDFSRLASGIISPSEIPDSPTQIVLNSPRRVSQYASQQPNSKPIARLRSVFEDGVNTFGVENTPAQFSTATSLSNLSLEDEPKIATDIIAKEANLAENLTEITDFHGHCDTENISQKPASLPGNESDNVLSDSEESDGDNLLFQNCINLGMNRIKVSTSSGQDVQGAQKKNDVLSDDSTSSSDAANDNLLEQCIRDGIQKTTATNPKNREQLKNALPNTLTKENPIGMLRKGGISSFIPSPDEVNKFHVEDSPCNYSVLSGLSDISVGSGVARLVKINRDSTNIQPTAFADTPQGNDPYRHRDDSLSSISLDSEDDAHILNQAIVAGSLSKIKSSLRSKIDQQNALRLPRQAVTDASSQIYLQDAVQIAEGNDSFSSIDSTDSNDHHTYILEECIRSGMHKDPKSKSKLPLSERFASKTIPSLIKTQLSNIQMISQPEIEHEPRTKDRERIDGSPIGTQIKPPLRHVKSVLAPVDYSQRLLNVNLKDNLNVGTSKNGETTSAAVLGITVTSATSTASGVETEHLVDGTKDQKRNQHNSSSSKSNIHCLAMIQTIKIGSSHGKVVDTIMSPNLKGYDDSVLQMSFGSLNLSSDGTALDSSNEYPALKLSDIEFNDDSHHESSFEMEISNEYLMERPDEILSPKIDKHKDPDLMLKSVDRLTQELVSTAEYLRTTTTSTTNDDITTVYENKSSSNSNTWNEDTCPNDVSFPSISMTAPMIASMNDDDATFSDTNFIKIDLPNSLHENSVHDAKISDEKMPSSNNLNAEALSGIDCNKDENWLQNASLESTLKFDAIPNSQPDSLDTDCNTIIEENIKSNDIEFHVGGAVQSSMLSPGSTSYNLNTATMTKSDIIAIEANKLVSELIDMQSMSESLTSLDLDNIRPPSGMDCVSLTGGYDVPNSPQLSKKRKKSLPFGIMARRALSHVVPSGSLESVNSNLDNVKPPSLMDELLDSMISVSSITSEVLDYNTAHLNVTSQYETALSDADDTTTISMELSMDQQTPIPSDISSAECTPKKVKSVKRTLTPRQKRHIVKDRYRTYTIAADIMVKEKIDELRNFSADDSDTLCEDESSFIENDLDNLMNSKQGENTQKPDTTSPIPVAKERKTIKQLRNDNKERYLTQIVKNFIPSTIHQNTMRNMLSTLPTTEVSAAAVVDNEIDTSITALTDKLHNITLPSYGNRCVFASEFDDNIKHMDNDLSSIDFEQNSETESCDQNHCVDEETYTLSPKAKPKIVVPTAAVIKQTIDNTPTDSNEQETKAIRGRIKVPYVSPYRRTTTSNTIASTNRTNLPVRNSLLETKKAVATKLTPKNQNVVAKTHVLINKSLLTNKIKTAKTGVAKSNLAGKKNVADRNVLNSRLSMMEKNKKLEIKANKSDVKIVNDSTVSTPLLERQGTFVKDEPTNNSVPIVSTTKSQPTSPAKTKLPSKLPTGKSLIPTSPLKSASTASQSSPTKLKLPSTKITNSNSPIGSRTGIGTQNTSTESSLKRRTIGYFRSPSTPNVPQRSNSNTSLRLIGSAKRDQTAKCSTQPPSRSNSNLMQPKQRDNISSNKSANKKAYDEAKVSSKSPSSSKLIRSSTFDNTPDKRSEQLQRQRLATPSKSNQPKSSEIIGRKQLPQQQGPTGVLQRIKHNDKTATDNSKRISRLNSFINVDE